MLASPATDEPSASNLKISSDAPADKRVRQECGDAQASKSSSPWRMHSNPLLNIPIGRRLALGFLIPALIAAITLSSVGVQSQQRLLQESTYYQHLFNAYTSLTAEETALQQMHTNLQGITTYAAQPHA